MKLKDITESSERWSTVLATMDANAPATALGILASLLILVLYPGCTAIENNRQIKLPSNVQASQAQKSGKTQWASNAKGLCMVRIWETLL
jgi:hypothetical protein